MAKTKMTKDIVPEGFTLTLALVDALPVVFFGLAFGMVGIILNSVLMLIGAGLALVSGTIKVLWKIIVVLKKKNVWWMFVQMRMAMPLGFVIMLIGFIIACCTQDLSAFGASLVNVPVLIFLALGVLGMVLMIVFGMKLDASDPKANWIEQLTNGLAQMCFFIAFLLAYLL